MHNDASPRFSSQKPPQALPEFAIRGARLSDAAAIQSIIETYARQRLMLLNVPMHSGDTISPLRPSDRKVMSAFLPKHRELPGLAASQAMMSMSRDACAFR